MLNHVLNRWESRTNPREVRTDITFTRFTNWAQINIRCCPPVTDELIHWVTDFRSFFDCRCVHGAKAPHYHPIGTLFTNVQPLCGLRLHFFHANWKVRNFKTHLWSKRLQKWTRLFAVTNVKVNKANLFAFNATISINVLQDR